MIIFAMDTSAAAASCALLEDDRPIAQFYTDAHLTHSQTIMPMAQALLECSHKSVQDIDLFAVSVGPGSFTGLRFGVAAGEAERRAKEMLDYFRLQEELWDIYPQTFSGGERLRLNLAHAMVKRPRLMLLDEPTASLDNKTKVLVKDILQQLKEEKTSMLGIFHDLEFMEGVCDKVFNMSEGSFA